MGDTKSKTVKDSNVVERVIFNDHHYKTTISDGKDKAEGLGKTSEESQRRASDKWDKVKGNDD